RLMTDWFTDELFADPSCAVVRHPVSRLVCDPERFASDDEEPMSRIGMGAIYRCRQDGSALRSTLSSPAREALIARFYEPHHRRLEAATLAALKRDHHCLVVDCH